VAERKLAEVVALKGGSAPQGAGLGAQDAGSELASLLSASPVVAETIPGAEAERMLQLLRSCGFAANAAGDYEAASNWFDCSFAVSSALSDLVSAANMRAKLLATSPVAALIYRHALQAAGAAAKVSEVAQRKLSALEAAVATAAKETARTSTAGDIAYETNA
jgi:hypothetical protein